MFSDQLTSVIPSPREPGVYRDIWELLPRWQVLLQGPWPGTGSPCLWGSHWAWSTEDRGWQSFRGQARKPLPSPRQHWFCAAQQPPGKGAPFVGLVLQTEKCWVHTSHTEMFISIQMYYCTIRIFILKYAKIFRDGIKIKEVIFPPILQWIILRTPGYVHNPLCSSGFKRQIYLTKSVITSPPFLG